MARFRTFFPEHKDKTVYGILAGVDWTATMKSRALSMPSLVYEMVRVTVN